MKVLSFSYCFPRPDQPTWGVFVRQRLAAMGRRIELQVVSPVPTFPLPWRLRGQSGPIRDRQDGMTVHRPKFFRIPGVFKSLDARLYARGLHKWLGRLGREFRPDLLDAHFVWPDGVGVSLLAQRAGLPYVITLRGKIYPCLEIRSQRRQCVEALRGAAAVISVSSPMAEIARDLGVSPDRVHVIPNGVDTERFRPGDKSAARRELGLAEDAPLIVSVAHLGPRKGHEQTVRALSRLGGDVRLVIVGGDPEAGRNERKLRELIAELGLAGRVILAGPQPYDRIPLYFNAADVGVLASHREGCPNVVLECLASGVPVVATRVGAVPDLLRGPGDGRIVSPRDAEALAEAIGEVLASRNSDAPPAACGTVESWDDVAEKVLGVFGRIQKN